MVCAMCDVRCAALAGVLFTELFTYVSSALKFQATAARDYVTCTKHFIATVGFRDLNFPEFRRIEFISIFGYVNPQLVLFYESCGDEKQLLCRLVFCWNSKRPRVPTLVMWMKY
jgi:hypothetical protein